MIHYIYKIHFLCGYPSGRYYIGRHSHRGKTLDNDKYTGSGNFCKDYFKQYGKKCKDFAGFWRRNRKYCGFESAA